MKKTWRWALRIIGVGVILVAILSVFISSQNDEKKITDFVIASQTELENIALSYICGDETTAKYKGVEVEGVYSGEHQIVQFYYSGAGIVPSTTY